MKYTRRSIIKKAGGAGLILFTPAIIKAAYSLTEPDKNNTQEISYSLDEWEDHLKKIDYMPDIILINNNSVKEFDMVSLGYNRERNNAPIVLLSKNDEWKPKKKIEINNFIKEIERFAERNNVYITYYNVKGYDPELNSKKRIQYRNRHTTLIKKIKECGTYNEISEDLYRPVSFIYANKYRDFDSRN